MAKRLNYLGILNQKGLLSVNQAKEAKELAAKTNVPIQEALKQLGYVTSEQRAQAVAQ